MSEDNELVKLILRYPDKPWTWDYLSENPNITMGIIERYPTL